MKYDQLEGIESLLLRQVENAFPETPSFKYSLDIRLQVGSTYEKNNDWCILKWERKRVQSENKGVAKKSY